MSGIVYVVKDEVYVDREERYEWSLWMEVKNMSVDEERQRVDDIEMSDQGKWRKECRSWNVKGWEKNKWKGRKEGWGMEEEKRKETQNVEGKAGGQGGYSEGEHV